ncbi:MFS transporter [Niallia circulans]|uniref:MFS transporter n=1 Tax=Niallia circulans TaxID=1397 RepID=A0A941GCA5_NIACI|nr:MFS transporter [Niallia circulans]
MDHVNDDKRIVNLTNKAHKTAKKQNVKVSKMAIFSLSSIPLVMTLGNSMLIPVLPSIEQKLNISSFQVSMIITVYSVLAIILIPVAGYLSDHIGRKRVIIPSLIIAAIGGVISGIAAWLMDNSYWVILIGRALQGVGAAGAFPIVLPLVGDLFKEEEEVSSTLGVIETANTFGKVLSPILGAFLAGFIWFIPFMSIPVFCLISIVLILFFVKSPKSKVKPLPFKQFIQHTKETMHKDKKWLYAIFFIGAIVMFVLFAEMFYLSDILEKKYQIKNIKKGLYLAIPLGALCLTSYITGKKIKKDKDLMRWITFIGLVAIIIGTIALNFSENMWFIIVFLTIAGIGIGASLPPLDALITEGIEKEERGTITSIYSSMRFIGVAAGPPIMAILMKHMENFQFYLLCSFALIAALAAFFRLKQEEKETQTK